MGGKELTEVLEAKEVREEQFPDVEVECVGDMPVGGIGNEAEVSAGLCAGGTAMLVVVADGASVLASTMGGRPAAILATLFTEGEALAIKLLLENGEAVEVA